MLFSYPKLLRIPLLALAVAGITQVHGQGALTTTGGNASGSEGTVSYSVGLPLYLSKTGSGGAVTEGVQQPYEIQVITSLANAAHVAFSLEVYPNPTTDVLLLKLKDSGTDAFHYQLLTLNGHLVEEQLIASEERPISMLHLPSAVYFLKILQGNELVKTFKIIKN